MRENPTLYADAEGGTHLAPRALMSVFTSPVVRRLAAGTCAAIACLGCKGRGPEAERAASVAKAEAGASAPSVPNEPPTFRGDVASVLANHCGPCHFAGGVAPFRLDSYAAARERHADIALATATGHMPPWLPQEDTCAKLRFSRAMDAASKDVLRRWSEAGAPEGSAGARAVAVPTDAGAPLVAPRAILGAAPAESYEPKRAREDDYHCFVLDPAIDAARTIAGFRIVPGEPAMVHHVVLYEVREAAVPRVAARDAAEKGVGYTCFGGIGVGPAIRAGAPGSGELVSFDTQLVAGWAPGADLGGATVFPAGTGIRLAKGSRLVMQVHYSLRNFRNGMRDRTRVDLFEGEPGLAQALWLPIFQYDIRVPPGVGPSDPAAVVRSQTKLPFPLRVHGAAPHMHLRGASVTVTADDEVGDAGAKSCLLDIPRWDFHHQQAYWFAEPRVVTSAQLTCRYDNRPESQPSSLGQRAVPRTLKWGEGTDDEMCLAFLYATP